MKNIFFTLLLLAGFRAAAVIPGGGGGGSVSNRVLYATTLTGYFPTNGGTVAFNLSGYTQPNSFSNQLVLALDTNVIFTSPETAGLGQRWNVAGTLQFDGSNVNSYLTLVSDDPSNRFSTWSTTLTNANSTNPIFSVQQAYDTNTFGTNFSGYYSGYAPTNANQNLVIFTGSLAANTVVPPATEPAFTIFGDCHVPTLLDVTNIAMSVGGTPGAPGTNGLNGTNGTNGTNGVNGTNGATGAAGTNTITAYNFTNAVFSSHYFTLYSSNYFVFTGSNNLGTFSQLQSWTLSTPTIGQVGTSPGTNAIENLFGSTNGGTSWFNISNSPCNFTNSIQLAVVGDSNSAPGSVFLQGLDHLELLNHTNYYDGQVNLFADAVNPQDAVNLETLTGILANSLNGQFVASKDTNFVSHSTLSVAGQTAIDVSYSQLTIANTYSLSGTNILIGVAQTNLVTGWTLQSNTNLALIYNWQIYTNYTTSTSGTPAVVTFTIPILKTTPQYFLVPVGPSRLNVTVTPTLGMLGGANFPSNTWNLFSITNAMKNFGYWQGNSNGSALVTLQLSNGVVRYVQVLQ